jgi:hypothetical protein
MKCSIGVGTNRFLAKLAASLHKPDGLDVIDHTNILEVYQRVSLLDLSGINTRYQARLNAEGIFTPTEFYNSRFAQILRGFKHCGKLSSSRHSAIRHMATAGPLIDPQSGVVCGVPVGEHESHDRAPDSDDGTPR